MASRGAALLSCALVFLSTAGPACSCPSISEFSCKEHTGAARGAPQPCGGNIFRCNNSWMEIQFGGRGDWFRVLGEKVLFSYDEFKIEDPTLSHIFRHTAGGDFLYTFTPLRGPLFAPPERTPATYSFLRDLQSYCNVSDYGLLFSKLIERYRRGPCTGTYDLSFTPRELQDYLPDPAVRSACLPGPADPDPMFVWTLWMNNTDTNSSTFNMASAGFARRRRPFSYCFNCEMRGVPCESGSAGRTYTCGKKHRNMRRNQIIIGASILTCLALLSLCIWCGIKKAKKPSSSTTLLSRTAASDKDPDDEVVSINYPTHVYRYQELHEATNGFSRANELDQGGHGAVYKGTLPDGRTVAIKRLYENNFNRAELFMNEVAILSGLRHPNLVSLYGCSSRHSRDLLLVYEFIPNGTIADHLHGHRAAEGALSWPLRLRIAVEAATALAYLHANKPQIIHRDVKTSNILLDADFHVKVGDFGMSRLFPVAASHVSTVPQGTPGYMDPQYHRCYQLTDKSDVYSFGVLLAELISSKPAVDMSRHQHEINLADMALTKIQSSALQELVDPKLGFETDREVRRSIHLVAELAMRCLQGERDIRPTMEAVLEVLQGIADCLDKAEKGMEGDHMVGDGIRLQKNREPPSPDTVMGQWSSRSTTPNASA